LPVIAGFIVRGEAKNCEKLGSCAITTPDTNKQLARETIIFFISAIKFFSRSRQSIESVPVPAYKNVISFLKIALLQPAGQGFRQEGIGKIQQIHDLQKDRNAAF
jgi:hypothetical protein